MQTEHRTHCIAALAEWAHAHGDWIVTGRTAKASQDTYYSVPHPSESICPDHIRFLLSGLTNYGHDCASRSRSSSSGSS
jgi:hypothetical protein